MRFVKPWACIHRVVRPFKPQKSSRGCTFFLHKSRYPDRICNVFYLRLGFLGGFLQYLVFNSCTVSAIQTGNFNKHLIKSQAKLTQYFRSYLESLCLDVLFSI